MKLAAQEALERSTKKSAKSWRSRPCILAHRARRSPDSAAGAFRPRPRVGADETKAGGGCIAFNASARRLYASYPRAPLRSAMKTRARAAPGSRTLASGVQQLLRARRLRSEHRGLEFRIHDAWRNARRVERRDTRFAGPLAVGRQRGPAGDLERCRVPHRLRPQRQQCRAQGAHRCVIAAALPPSNPARERLGAAPDDLALEPQRSGAAIRPEADEKPHRVLLHGRRRVPRAAPASARACSAGMSPPTASSVALLSIASTSDRGMAGAWAAMRFTSAAS